MQTEKSFQPADKAPIDVVIIGSGPSGLATALELSRLGISATILESKGTIAGDWSSRLNDRELTTPSDCVRLMPDNKLSKWITGDQFWAHLKRVAAHQRMDVRLNSEVQSVRRKGAYWVLRTRTYQIECLHLVVATGQDAKPKRTVPKSDTIRTIHASEFSKADANLEDTLVVGLGTSGAEIASAVAKSAGEVTVSLRSIPLVLPRSFLGVPTARFSRGAHFLPDHLLDMAGALVSFSAYGRPSWGVQANTRLLSERRSHRYAPTIDLGFMNELKAGRVKIVSAFSSIDSGEVRFVDGASMKARLVVDATGYEPNFGQLFGRFWPDLSGSQTMARAQPSSAAPCLYFVGLRNRVEALGSYLRRESRQTAKQIADQLSYDT